MHAYNLIKVHGLYFRFRVRIRTQGAEEVETLRTQPLLPRGRAAVAIAAQEIAAALHLASDIYREREHAAERRDGDQMPSSAADERAPAELMCQKALHETVHQQVQQVQVHRAFCRHLRAHVKLISCRWKRLLSPARTCRVDTAQLGCAFSG